MQKQLTHLSLWRRIKNPPRVEADFRGGSVSGLQLPEMSARTKLVQDRDD